MSRRFNPPPGWPPAPEGFEPPPGWQPDPSWPPPPAGWQFWIDDDPFGLTDAPPPQQRRVGRPVVLAAAAVAAVAVGGTIGGAIAVNAGHHDAAAPRGLPHPTSNPTSSPAAVPTPQAGAAPTEVPTVTTSTATTPAPSGSATPGPSVTEVADLPVASLGDCWRRKSENAYAEIGCTEPHVAQVFGVATASRPDAYRRAKKPVQTARHQAQTACRRAERATRLTSRGERSDVGVSVIYPQDSTLADPTSSAGDLQIVCLLKLEKGTTTAALLQRR